MDNKIILTEEDSISNALTTVWTDGIKNELQKNIEFSQAITITDAKDKKQLQTVKDTKNWYVKTRNTIKRAFKSKRDKNTQENRDNLEAEREVLLVIEAEENRLNDLVIKVELEILREENTLKLIDRKEALRKCEYETEDDLLLVMKEKDFEELLTNKRFEFVAIEEARIQADKEKIAREKELEEARKQAKIEAEQEAQKKADLEKQRVEQEKVEAERKQKEELERVEQEKKDEIDRIKKEQEAKELKERQDKLDLEAKKQREEAEKQAEKELMEKRKAFTDYRDSIEFDHYEDKDGKRIFYKKVWEFNI